jgi:predicted NBD/HSP70 family sugar kinase
LIAVTADGPTAGRLAVALRPDRSRLGSTPEDNRLHNRALILQSLFRQGAVSRADLARSTGLTRTSISALVSDLASEGLISELGLRDDSRVGKPANLVGLRADAYSIIAVDLSADDRFSGAVIDLAGSIVSRDEVDAGTATGEDAVEMALELCGRLADSAPRPVLGFGISAPGIITPDGVVLEGLYRDWTDLPLASRVSERFGAPAHVGNDANAAALGIRTYGQDAANSLLVVHLEHGVGLGVVIDGVLVRGERFSAGEIGHVTVDELGERCACGRRGCLETVIGTRQLTARLENEAPQDVGRRDEILEDAGRALGQVLAPIVSALNLNDVVVTGPPELLTGPFEYSVLRTLRARTFPTIHHGLGVRIADTTRPLILLGAASLVLSAELGIS